MNAPLLNITLEDKYALSQGRVFLTGTQALVRLLFLQHQRDALAGLDTAGYVSGYRGSPLGGLDQALWKAKAHLAKHQVVFQPGVNEDLAATALWGTQQVNLAAGAKHDGVFGMWYGKGPGVDRCGDVFKHANCAGTWKHGGILAVAGDDHAARSSTVAHQSEHAFKAAMMPVLVPAGVQDYLDLGLHGWAISRYSGCWVGFKAVADTVESSASVDVSPDRVKIVLPTDYELPNGGLNIRWPDDRLLQEARLLDHKLYAALAYCRANRLDQIVIDAPQPRLGIITTGKSYLDVRQAFDDLGIDDALAAEIGIRLYKVGMVWPLESEGVRRFAEGLEEILVVEEKRQLIEYQLKEELYNWREDVRPRVIGKFDEKGEWALPHGRWLLPAAGELSPAQIARVIAERIGRHFTSPRIRERLALLEAKERAASPVIPIARTPYFCPGCPHNSSTKVPEGSRALAGIGCHFMVLWMNRNTSTYSHMGGEGAAWIGQAPFTEQQHVFVNLGDGTYFHSGVLAIRAAVAAFNGGTALGKGVTYKILYNDAVAMTGGQAVDGSLTVPQIAAQLHGEGVHHVVVVTDGSPRAYGPRRSAARRADPAPRRTRRRAARDARMPRCLRHHLRPDLRRGKAPPSQARQDDRPAAPPLHQRSRLRRLRRLRHTVELPRPGAAGNRVRPQARHRPVRLQQGLFLREGLLPQLRFGARRTGAQGARRGCRQQWRRRIRRLASADFCVDGAALRHRHHRCRWHGRGDARRTHRHGRPHRRQGRYRTRHDRPGAERWRRLLACAHLRRSRGDPRRTRRHRRCRRLDWRRCHRYRLALTP
jgi:indolepyruvate ferredoxin oxidoreductase